MIAIGGDVTCLVDTGADTPVWTQGNDTLCDFFKAEKIEEKKFIFPATAFTYMNYTIRNVGVSDPVIEIEHDKEEYAVSAVYSNTDNSFVERVYSFAND